MEFDIADPPLPIMEFSIFFFIFLNEGFPNNANNFNDAKNANNAGE